MAEGKDLISCRTVLWYMVFSGCAMNYMFKINLNLVLVAIVLPKKTRASVAQCAVSNVSKILSNVTSVPSVVASPSATPEELEHEGRFEWNEYEQGLIIGAFYWLYWASQVPGGVLGRRYGAKKIFGGGNLLSAIICLLLPFAMKFHIVALLLCRCFQGLIMGVMYPSIHGLPVSWVPPNERSRFLTACLGGSVGTAVTYPLCATIIHYFNWEAAFYVSSSLGIVWFLLWSYLVYDTPHQHPRISLEELEYISKNTPPPIVEKKKRPVPWCSILTSGPLWVTISAQWGIAWGFFTLLAQAPSYFNYIHGWSLHMTGILSGLPHLALMAFALLIATLGDYLLRSKAMSLSAVRKLATILATGGQGLMLIGLSFSGCRPNLAVTFMILGTAMNGAMSTGTISNVVDLSPNYAGVLLGIMNLVCMATAFLSPMIVGLLTNNNQTTQQWQWVFLIAAANLMAGCIVYILFGTSEEQPWNDEAFESPEIGEELEKLKPGDGSGTGRGEKDGERRAKSIVTKE
ncbi:sialin-like [Venturia canescens]|uniref:sialin-like n=1 Tax=Venturia canescens TaxID=32260 RepID=UPI001C9D4381|nr:sialin-like [Venturia canescens]